MKKKMSKKSMLLVMAVAASMLLFGQGCWISYGPGGGGGGLDTGEGSMLVDWSFEGSGACPLDVDEVVIELRDGSGARIGDDIIVGCGAGSRSIPALAEGNYTVHIKGLDVDDAITWESGSRTIYVDSDATAHVSFDLAPAP